MAVLHKLDGNGETVFNQNHAGLVGLSLHTLTSCYKHTHCFQQPLWHTQFGTLCHLGRTVLLTSHTDGESGDVRHAGRRDKRPTRTPYPCPYWAHCPALASAAKLTWKKKLLKLDHVRVIGNGMKWSNYWEWNWKTGVAIIWSSLLCLLKTLLSLWSAHLFNAFVGYEGVAVSQAVAIWSVHWRKYAGASWENRHLYPNLLDHLHWHSDTPCTLYELCVWFHVSVSFPALYSGVWPTCSGIFWGWPALCLLTTPCPKWAIPFNKGTPQWMTELFAYPGTKICPDTPRTNGSLHGKFTEICKRIQRYPSVEDNHP